MKIAQDACEYARERGFDEIEDAVDAGIKEKEEEFLDGGAATYRSQSA